MSRGLLAILLLVFGCGDRMESFKGPLAVSADSLFDVADISCHKITPNEMYLHGRISRECSGMVADTFVAMMVAPDDTVDVIRRVWGTAATTVPRFDPFSEYQKECGVYVARSRDGLLMSTFRLDSAPRGATLVFARQSVTGEQLRTCSGLP
jgi:hypothetical protein